MDFKLIYAREIANQVYHKSTHTKTVFAITLKYVYIETATCFALAESFKRKQNSFLRNHAGA